MKRFLSSAVATSVAAAAIATMLATSTASALTFTSLTLVNDWVSYSTSTNVPAVALDSKGVVHFRGGIKQTSAGSLAAFTLPATFRPNKVVYVVTNLYNAHAGRLIINTDGTVSIDYAGSVGDARGFTSLEGVTFAR